MAYQKPKCECGNDLIYYTSHSIEVWHDINSSGKIKVKPFKTQVSPMSTQDEILICKNEECDNEYVVHWEDGQLIRGSKI
jgi:hypothetical protein